MGTGSVYSVEGEGAVLPAWYTSSSQKRPYISWMLKKAAAKQFQVMGMEWAAGRCLKCRPWW